MTRTLLAAAASCAALSVATLSSAALAQTYAVTNARLLVTGEADDPGMIRGGTVVIEDGVITAIGRDVRVPSSAEIIDAEGRPVTPGLFAALSGVGLEEIGLNREGNDRSARGERALSASLDAADGFYADSSVIPVSRAGGVTRAYVAPDPGSDLFGGCGMVVDLSGAGDPITERCLAQTVSLGYSGASRAGDSRPAAMARLRRALEDAALYAEDPERYRETYEEGRLPLTDARALAPVLTGEQKLLAEVHGASDIRRVLDLARRYDIDLVLFGATEAYRVAGRIAEQDVPVILFPLANLPDRFEQLGATLNAAAALEEAGVTVAFYDNDIGYTHNVRALPQLAGNAVANGMSYGAALSAITANPAIIWGLSDELGTLAAGKKADLVIWSGDPLELMSAPEAVFIDGERASLENRQTALTRRYRDLQRGDKPFAYRGN